VRGRVLRVGTGDRTVAGLVARSLFAIAAEISPATAKNDRAISSARQ